MHRSGGLKMCLSGLVLWPLLLEKIHLAVSDGLQFLVVFPMKIQELVISGGGG